MRFSEAATLWKLLFDVVNIGTGPGITKTPFNWHLGAECDSCLVHVPDEIYKTCCFFPAQGLGISTVEPIDLLTREFAQALSDNSVFLDADWLVWISDTYQQELYQWVSFDEVDNDKERPPIQKTQIKFALAYLFWKGLFLYLDTDERWQTYNARFLYLITAWQWFHLIRYLSRIWIEARDTQKGNPDLAVENNLRWLNNELIAATQALQDLIQRVDFRFAVRQLIHHLDPNSKEGRADLPEVERLIYGMLLEGKEKPLNLSARWTVNRGNAFSRIGGNMPIYAPDQLEERTWELGSVIKNDVAQKLSWQWRSVDLHTVFLVSKNWNLQSFARMLIRKWLLPRYDFSGALHLAMLLRSYQQEEYVQNATAKSEKWFRDFLIYVIIWAIVLLIDFLAPIPLGILKFDIWNYSKNVSLGILFFAILIAGGFWLIFHRFDRQAYQYLLLPRLLGGILVGYAALVLSADSLTLKNALFAECAYGAMWCPKNVCQTIVLWIAILGIGWWYFYYECFARIQHKKMSCRRSLLLLVISIAASTLIGLFAVSLTTAMEWQSDACKGFGTLLCPVQGYFMIGPIGIIDVRQFFIFIPLATLTGFISQFLFEEKPITASVWEE